MKFGIIPIVIVAAIVVLVGVAVAIPLLPHNINQSNTNTSVNQSTNQADTSSAVPAGWTVYTHQFGTAGVSGTRFSFAYPPNATNIYFPKEETLDTLEPDTYQNWNFIVGDRYYSIAVRPMSSTQVDAAMKAYEDNQRATFQTNAAEGMRRFFPAYLYSTTLPAETIFYSPGYFFIVEANVPDPEAGLQTSGVKPAPDKDATQVLIEHSIQINGYSTLPKN